MQDWAEMGLPICTHFVLISYLSPSFQYYATIFSENLFIDPANIYLVKVNNRNTRKRCEICSKLTIKTPERRQLRVFIGNFEYISHLFLVFLWLTFNR